MGGIVVLVSGGGTTLQNLIDAAHSGRLAEPIRLVIADRPCKALERAEKAAIPSHLIDRKSHSGCFSETILDFIPPDTSLLVLGGFLSILGPPVVDALPGRIVNIHPSLLPRHGGPGMYGIHVHRAVIASGDQESGCTVHYVDHGTDTGEIILQRRCAVVASDTPETLQQKVAALEGEAILTGVRAALGAVSGAMA